MKDSFSASIVGLGGLGCPALIHLIENWPKDLKLTLQLVDNDIVELSNLNRQILFNSSDVGKLKSQTAAEKTLKHSKVFPENISLTTISEKLSVENINTILAHDDFILDCTDDISCKVLLNEFALLKDKILVYAGVQGTEGVVQVISNSRPCLICSFGDFSKEEECEIGGACRSGGVIGSIAGITAVHQVNELLEELFLDKDSQIVGHKIIMIKELGQVRKIRTAINPNCPMHCGFSRRKKINLNHLKCPETFLFSKLALEKVRKEEYHYAEIIFSSIEDLKNVSKSLVDEGNKIELKIIKPEFSYYSVICRILGS